MSEKRTELSEIGEFGLIERIKNKTKISNKNTVLGIGDDAAVINTGEDLLLISTDILSEGVHFDLTYMPIKHLGYKAVTVNVSDIAAMNGIPEQITVSLALSNRFSVEAVDALYEGIQSACDNYKIDLVGGDTTTSKSGLLISITVLGRVKPKKITYRSGAEINDLICVTGDLGGAFMGLQILEREKQVFLSNPEMQPDLEGKNYIIEKQLKPEARMDIIYELKELGIVPTSMIDISDGLASELLHICKNSKIGIQVFEHKLPIDKLTYDTAMDFNIDPLTCMLNGGEDYELLFTVKQEYFEKIKNHPDISIIGIVKEQSSGANLISKGGNSIPLKAQGWVHF